MSEQKSMSRLEMVVGSYVCPVDGDGPRGEVVRVEHDARGPEYDLLHVKVSPWGQPQRCQRAVMMLAERPEPEPAPAPKVEQGVAVQWRHDTMPNGVWRRGTVRLRSRGKWEVEDAAGFMVHVDDIEACIMVAKDGLPLTAEEQIAALKADLEAYRSTFEEVNEAYHKAHEALAREIANHEAADKYGRKAGDERDALRAQLLAREESEAVKLKGLRQVAHDRAYEIERQKHEIALIKGREREALAEAAAQRERADMWQAAAQDALDQMAHWRKQAKEKTKLCDMTVDIDFRHTGTVATLAKIAPPRDKRVQL